MKIMTMGIVPWIGILGLIGFAGLATFRRPVDPHRSGGGVRKLGLLGLLGLAGIWIEGAGACGAFGALGLWNHQDSRFAVWGRLALLGTAGLPFLLDHFL